MSLYFYPSCICFCFLRFQRQESRDSLNSVDSQNPTSTHQHQQLRQQPGQGSNGGAQFRQNGNQLKQHPAFIRQTSHENLVSPSSSSSPSVALVRSNNGGNVLYRPHSREILGQIHETPGDATDNDSAASGKASRVGSGGVAAVAGVHRGNALRRARVFGSCDNILQHNGRDLSTLLSGVTSRSSETGSSQATTTTTTTTKNNRPQFLHGIGAHNPLSGSLSNVVSPSSSNLSSPPAIVAATSPFARPSSAHQQHHHLPQQVVSPSTSKEKPLTPRRMPSTECLSATKRMPSNECLMTTKRMPSTECLSPTKRMNSTECLASSSSMTPNGGRCSVSVPAQPVGHMASAPPVPPHRTPTHETASPSSAVAKPAGYSNRVFQPLTLEINPGLCEGSISNYIYRGRKF